MATRNQDNEIGKKNLNAYPYLPIASALKVAEALKELGGARSTIPKSLLAKHLGEAEGSMQLSQRITSAKCFGLVEGHGTYSLTETAKRYFFPTSENDKASALLDVFASPPAFQDLLRRFDGDKLPGREILGNILHRELKVPESWKERVAGLFCGAAQHVGVIDSQGFLRYEAARHSAGSSTEDIPPAAEEPTPSMSSFAGILRPKPASAPGIVQWRYKAIEVTTPENLDRALWMKLNAYVQLLEPTDENNFPRS